MLIKERHPSGENIKGQMQLEFRHVSITAWVRGESGSLASSSWFLLCSGVGSLADMILSRILSR